jgi:hypothetical protein
MQYIQLQGQDPEEINIPAEGSFNLFFDSVNNSIVVKDHNGNVINSGGGITEVSYEELYTLGDTGSFVPGKFYLITDYRTCYDQPNWDSQGNPIVVGNYKVADVEEPLIVLATSIDTLSPYAYSTVFPKDVIKYDITFNETEVTSSPAKGRITERIDENNNRADYDFRTVQFIRYQGFYSERYYHGTISIDGETGIVTGTGTSFSNDFNIGDVLGVYDDGDGPYSCFVYYEIGEIIDNLTMSLVTVTGGTINFVSGRKYSKGILFDVPMSPLQCDLPSYGDSSEYYTFNGEVQAYNNYLGDNSDFDVFILSNNVFMNGTYRDNYFHGRVIGNTFSCENTMHQNTFGSECEFNIIKSEDFDDNTIGPDFRGNTIICRFTDNIIGSDFLSNMIGDSDGEDFEENTIGLRFQNNFIIMEDDFRDNRIGNEFGNNIIDSRFYRNNIGNDFRENITLDDNNFQNNEIGNQFNNNVIYQDFYKNDIGNGYNGNNIKNEFYGNLIGNGFNENTIEDDFYENQIGDIFENNEINYEFRRNQIGTDFRYNNINSDFFSNFIGNEFDGNTIVEKLFGWDNLSNVADRNYSDWQNSLDNQIGNNIIDRELVMRIISTGQYFKIKFTQWTQGGSGGGFSYERTEIDSSGNPIGSMVTFTKTDGGDEVDIIVEDVVEITRGSQNGIYNVVTEGGYVRNVSPNDTEWNSNFTARNNSFQFNDNFIRNGFESNNINGTFSYNMIGNMFYDNTIADDFGFGGGNHRGNVIGNNFNNNNIGEYFYDNNIGDNFEYNAVGNYFQFNRVEAAIGYTDFTEYYGNLINISYPPTSGTDGVYTNITPTSTSGIGFNTMFDIIVTSDLVDTVTITNAGKLYEINDTITIPSSSFGGDTDLILTVTDTSYRPEVYANYNKTIQRAADGNAVLTVILPGEGYYPFITPNITQAID